MYSVIAGTHLTTSDGEVKFLQKKEFFQKKRHLYSHWGSQSDKKTYRHYYIAIILYVFFRVETFDKGL